MTLQNYLASLARGEKKRFAHQINVSSSFLRQMETGKSKVPPIRAKQIEEATNGIVKKEDMRPDLWK